MNTPLKGWVMKRIALLTILVGLFFGALSSASASVSANLPPLQYYVRWHTPVTYTCTHSNGQYELFVALTHLDYLAPNSALMSEVDMTDNSFGHFVSAQDAESDWMNWSGTRKHTTYTVDSASYPITLKANLKTFIDNVPVYESTFTAQCAGNSHGSLNASINNNDHPLYLQAGSEPGLTTYHP